MDTIKYNTRLHGIKILPILIFLGKQKGHVISANGYTWPFEENLIMWFL